MIEEAEMDGGYQSEGERGEGSQHSQPPDQLHSPPACVPREREQQGCLHISCFLCPRDKAAGRVEVGVTLAWGPARVAGLCFPLACRILALGKRLPVSVLW